MGMTHYNGADTIAFNILSVNGHGDIYSVGRMHHQGVVTKVNSTGQVQWQLCCMNRW